MLGPCRGWEQGSGGPLTPGLCLCVPSTVHGATRHSIPWGILNTSGLCVELCLPPAGLAFFLGQSAQHLAQQSVLITLHRSQLRGLALRGRHLARFSTCLARGPPPLHNFLAPVASTPHIHGPEWKVQRCLEKLRVNLWHLCLNLGCAGGLPAKLLPSY